MAKKQERKGTDLGALQAEAERAASRLKGANTVLINARQAAEKAQEAYAAAQRNLALGMEQVKSATRVS